MEQVQTSNLVNQPTTDNKVIKCCQVCNEAQKELLRCARCKQVYYCGAQCQKKHWPSHKINCSKAKENCNPENDKKSSQNINTTKLQPQNPYHGLNEFGKLTHLGSGNFSQIFKATSKKDGKTYAIKQVQKAKVQRIRKEADLFMEKHCLSKLKDCDYAIKLYRTFQDDLNLFIQMQCPQNGQLWQQARTFGLFSEPIFKYFASHLVKALSIIHNEYQIVHRDLKPENILLDQMNRVKLIDFGTAKDLSRPDIVGSGNGLKGKKPFEHYVGTPNYMAPECIHNKASQKKSDIYSLSGVFYFMKTGAPPFTGGSEFIVFKKSLETQLFTCPQLFSTQLQDLIAHMNKKSMEQRYDIIQVMKHAYFSDVDFDNLPSYQQALSECSLIQKYLYGKGKQIFEKFHKIALEDTLQNRQRAFDKEISPLLQSLKQKLPQSIELSKQKLKWLQKRVEMMKMQAKVMMNYHDDNSSGFSQIYQNDFNSAERLINEVKHDRKNTKNSQNSTENENQEIQQEDEQPENQEELVNMRKDKQESAQLIQIAQSKILGSTQPQSESQVDTKQVQNEAQNETLSKAVS